MEKEIPAAGKKGWTVKVCASELLCRLWPLSKFFRRKVKGRHEDGL